MNQKEIAELRRCLKPQRRAISKVYGCFVNAQRETIAGMEDMELSLGMLAEDTAEKYISLLGKVLTGKQDKNLIDISFSSQQVMDNGEHRLLSALKDSRLQNREVRLEFYQKIVETLEMGEYKYLILLAYNAYDVPHKGKDGETDADNFDETFSFIICAICPLKEGKIELGYFPIDGEFRCASGETVSSPDIGFVFPAFDDRRTNIYNALYYSKKPDELHQEFIDTVFHVEPPISAPQQKEIFQTSLCEAMEGKCSIEIVQAVHDEMSAKIAEHKESKDPEPLTVSIKEISGILQDCGVSDEATAVFAEKCEEQMGEAGANVELNPEVIIDTGRFEIKKSTATVLVNPEFSSLIETRKIDGKKYILVPAEDGMLVNGVPVVAVAE